MLMPKIRTLPVSAIIATRNRSAALAAALASLRAQQILPAQLIVVDGSDDDATRTVVVEFERNVAGSSVVQWQRAATCGAAAQRNQGFFASTQPVVWFFDDDIYFEAECVARLWRALEEDASLGGVNAMIVNQSYHPPGLATRVVLTLLSGRCHRSFAGLVVGPAVNLLADDGDGTPPISPVEWLNTTCTMYRRHALPVPPFDYFFTDYSLMEDLALSLRVGRRWNLANVRGARIVHNSRPAAYKADLQSLVAMELNNRHYVMTEVLRRRTRSDYMRLFAWEMFQLTACALSANSDVVGATWRGKWQGIRQIRQRARQTSKNSLSSAGENACRQ